MHDPIQNRISHGRIIEQVVPLLRRELAGDQQRSLHRLLINDIQQDRPKMDIDANPTAKALLLLIRDGRLLEATAEPEIKEFLDKIAPTDPDAELAMELYNGQLWTNDPGAQRRNLLAAAIAHFEARKPIDKVAALARSSGSTTTLQINLGTGNRNAGRDYIEG